MFQKILVPFDGSLNAQRALDKAADLAALTGGVLSVLTVFRHHSMLEASLSMVRPADHSDHTDEEMKAHARELAETAKARATARGLRSVRAFIKPGQPARTIVAFAREQGYDLIVRGSRGLGSVEGYLLGSVSHKVTGLARCPVLVV